MKELGTDLLLSVCRFSRWNGTKWLDGQAKVVHCWEPNGERQDFSVLVEIWSLMTPVDL